MVWHCSAIRPPPPSIDPSKHLSRRSSFPSPSSCICPFPCRFCGSSTIITPLSFFRYPPLVSPFQDSMETSKRAVEAYKRTRLVDLVITDDDKVAPMYRFDEIAEMLRTSSSDLVHEVVLYVMKRLGSKSPRVKQKVLRMIKFVVSKGGPEFKRQVQRQSAVIRQLFEYKGQQDSLRGDALNKAVRDTAHEAITAIFAPDEKPAQVEEASKRIMGFGSANYDVHAGPDNKKSSITDIVSDAIDFGSASIKQGLTILSSYTGAANTPNVRSDVGSYRSPNLKKSLTSERGTFDRDDLVERGDSTFSSGTSNTATRPSASNAQPSQHEGMEEVEPARRRLSPEERLLDTITAPGGMRLQPTRESLQKFLSSAVKLDPKSFCYVLESKLKSHAWQVRFRALCVLEAIVRQPDHDFLRAVLHFFEEDTSAITDCLQSPQASVKEKALKIVETLSKDSSEKMADGIVEQKEALQPSLTYDMHDLIDTGELDSDAVITQEAVTPDNDTIIPSISTSTNILGDLLGGVQARTETGSDDIFSGVSFHTPGVESTTDLFSGLSLENTTADGVADLLNGFHDGKDKTSMPNALSSSDTLADLMTDVSLKSSMNDSSLSGLVVDSSTFGKSLSVQGNSRLGSNIPSEMLGSMSNLQNPMMHLNPSMLPMGMAGNYQTPMVLPHNFGLPNNAVFQQQYLAGMAGLQRLNMGMYMMNGNNHQSPTAAGGPYADDLFFSGDAMPKVTTESAKKEDTRAFDFILDHVSAARVSKKSS